MESPHTTRPKGIELRSLVVGYRSGKTTRPLNHPATEEAPCGTLTCLIGSNGAGKSTLLRTIGGFQPPIGGEVRVAGQSVDGMAPRRRAELMAVVLTDRPNISCTTVSEMVALGRAPYTGFWGRLGDSDREAVERALRLVDIEALAGRAVASLSDGERQKVMIAKALAQQTPVILLDEPTAFLDYPSKVETMLLLRRLARDEHKAVLLSTHDLELALQTADRLWLMQKAADGTGSGSCDTGTLTGGTPRELAASGAISRFVDRDHVAFDPGNMTVRLKA